MIAHFDPFKTDALDASPLNENALKAAFDRMESMALQMVEARRSGDLSAFEAASQEMRRAQAVFLRDLNRFPAETAQFLAHRQADFVEAVAHEGFDLDLFPQPAGLAKRGHDPVPGSDAEG